MKKLGESVEKLGKNITVVTGKEEWKIVLFGELKGEVLYSTRRPLIQGAPFLLVPGSLIGREQDTIDVHGKPTTVGALIAGPEVCGFKAGGMLMAALYSETIVADRYGFLPLVAYGELKDDFWRFAAGLQLDVFNPLNPNMVNFNNLFNSGNTGLYRGQVRLERYFYLGPEAQLTFQGAISEPLPTTFSDTFRLSEDNGIPNLDTRVALAFGLIEGEGLEAKRPFEVGLSISAGQIRTTQVGDMRVIADVFGVGADLRYKVTDWFGFQGEVFHGQGLGTYGGNILQTVNTTTFEAIRGSGGWAEIYFYLTPCVHLHLGYGIDDPKDGDLAFGQILRNDTTFGTIFWDVTKAFRVGLEVSHRVTSYHGLPDNDAMLLHTQFRWAF